MNANIKRNKMEEEKLTAKEAWTHLREKFTSGNSVPVQIARITREEYDAIKNDREKNKTWIPIEQTKQFLPNMDEYVLWLYESGGIVYECINKEMDVDKFINGNNITGPIIAWMHAPEYIVYDMKK
jgi:hypothetical protein